MVFALDRQGEALGGQQWVSSLRSSPKHSTGSQKCSQQKLVEMQILGRHLMDQKLAWSLAICFDKPSSDHKAR